MSHQNQLSFDNLDGFLRNFRFSYGTMLNTTPDAKSISISITSSKNYANKIKVRLIPRVDYCAKKKIN